MGNTVGSCLTQNSMCCDRNVDAIDIQSLQVRRKKDHSASNFQSESMLVFRRDCNLQNVQFLSFSQRRFVGFRQLYEFDHKRVIVANQNSVTVLSFHAFKTENAL